MLEDKVKAPKPVHQTGEPTDEEKDKNPKYTIVVIGEDGGYYKLTYKQWHNESFNIKKPEKPSQATDAVLSAAEKNAMAAGVVKEIEQLGSYLAFVPLDMAVGIGYACTVINLKSIFKNNP